MRSTGNSTRGCLPLLETDNSVFCQGGVSEHRDRVVNYHHVFLILGHRPALVVQSALKRFTKEFYFFCWSIHCKRRHQGRHNLGHIPVLRVSRPSPLVKFTIIHSPGCYTGCLQKSGRRNGAAVCLIWHSWGLKGFVSDPKTGRKLLLGQKCTQICLTMS